MSKKSLPEPIEVNLEEPVYFPQKDEICRKLDEFYKILGVQKNIPPSTMNLHNPWGWLGSYPGILCKFIATDKLLPPSLLNSKGMKV